MNGKTEPVPYWETPVTGTRHDIKRAVDGERADRQLQFIGQHEGSPAKPSHVSCEAACAFGENNDRHTLTERFARRVVSLLYLAGTTLVHINVVGLFTGKTNQGDFPDGLFHHPFEVTAEEAVDEKDVKSSLVIADKDIALPRVKMFASFDFHGEEEQTDRKPRPVLAGIISPEVPVAQLTADGGCQSGKYGGQDKER